MTHELPGALGHDGGDATEELFVEHPSYDDAERAIGSREALAPGRVAELSSKRAENSYLGIARPKAGARQQFTGLQRLARAEGVTNRAHAAGPCRAQQRLQHRRKQVGMFVSIEVRDMDAGRLQLADLRARLGFDFARIQATGQSTDREGFQPIAEAGAAGRL